MNEYSVQLDHIRENILLLNIVLTQREKIKKIWNGKEKIKIWNHSSK